MEEKQQENKSWGEMTLVEKSQIVFFGVGGVFTFILLLYLGFGNDPDPDDDAYWTGFTVLWVCAVSFCGLGGLTFVFDYFMKRNKENVGVAPEIEQTTIGFKNLRY